MAPTWGLQELSGGSCLHPQTVSTHSQREWRKLVQWPSESGPSSQNLSTRQGVWRRERSATKSHHSGEPAWIVQGEQGNDTLSLFPSAASFQVKRQRAGYPSSFTIFYSIRIIAHWESQPSHEQISWLPRNEANISGVTEQGEGQSWL